MEQLHHLYINPLEKCNLRCRICYTKKTTSILTEKQIVDFIKRYKKEVKLQTVTFCGGEVFALPYFPHLVNVLTKQGLIVQIITNGTIDRLNELGQPDSLNLIVSVDGLPAYHDKNRGEGNFQKSIDFIKKAKQRGFHTEIFSIVTKQNLKQIGEFEKFIIKTIGLTDITYHPRKPLAYLKQHPVSNIAGQIDGFDYLTDEEMVGLMETKKVFPPKKLGCYQISLMSDGKVYGCCEGYLPIGTINDPSVQLINQLYKNVKGPCPGCCQPEFMCGIKDIIAKINHA